MTDEKRNNFKRQRAKSPQTTTENPTRSTRRQRSTVVEEEGGPKRQLWVQIRILPIWLRVILVLVLLIGTAIIGAMIGYGYIGDGDPGNVLKKETWTHILDIINGKES